MADRTLTINHADGGSETYTLKTEDVLGVRSMSVDGETVTVDRTAPDLVRTIIADGQTITIDTTREGVRTLTVDGTEITIDRTEEANLESFLQQFTGASAAYSLRDLAGFGNTTVVRVRRSSDNAEADFKAKEVSDGTLVAWVGAGNDGFVETWYDQSGNGADAVQQVSGSQPKIVDAGSLVTDANGKPEMDFDGVNDWFTLGVSQLGNTELFADSSDSWFITGVATYDHGTLISKAGVSGFGREFQIYYFEGTNSTYTRGSRTNLSSDVNQRLVSYNWDGANAVVGLNGTLNAVSVGTASKTSRDINIGARTDGQFLLNGSLQEIIIYDSDQSANRVAIEDNINNQYDIY